MYRFVAILCFGSFCALAQPKRAGIDAAVTDPSGSIVPNASATITTAIGTYSVSNLEPARFTGPLDPNFWSKNVNSFDITRLNEYQQYQLKGAYRTNFGTLYNSSTPRYLRLGLRLYF